ncbi:hypothetical protein FRC06_008293 [Ceratobasidium sp. 370]|nr:hypothetical protein FRC06_008293 [Ceratobasidium sp. 370]
MQGFTEHTTTVSSGASIYCQYRRSSDPEAVGRPLLVLIHGYPQNHLMWEEFVKGLPDDFAIVIPDLPGYGNSTKLPSADNSSRAHSKRAWAQDIIEAARQIHDPSNHGQNLKLIAFGHDRGARLAYRMTLDAPGIVVGLAVLDIVPTPFMWARMSLAEARHEETRKSHHWYRAGSTIDVEDDLASGIDPATFKRNKHDAGASGVETHIPIFSVPVLVLSSMHLRRRFPVDEIWRSLCTKGGLVSLQIEDDAIGHFFVNEATRETLEGTVPWLNQFK